MIDLRPGHYIVLLAVLFTFKDLYLNNMKSSSDEGTGSVQGGGSSSSSPGDSFDHDKIMPDFSGKGAGSKLSSAKFVGPAMKFLFCTSWGYKNAYEHYSAILQERYPEIMLEYGSFPPTYPRQTLAQIIGIVKFLLLGCIFMNINPLDYLGIQRPGIWNWVSQNKIYASLMSFFLCNLCETQLLSTGAFEIYFNDVPVWSKLQTGRIPSPPELLQIVDNSLKMVKNVNDFDDLGL